MVTFDSRLPGTPADVWAADERFGALPDITLDGISELIVIAAHPDDETLGAGGLMAQCSARGIPVHVVIVTDGGGSHPHSPSITPVHLSVVRRLEVAKATAVLAPAARITFLDFEDGSIDENRDQVAAEMRCIVDRAAASALLVAPWRGDGHRDHRVLGEICVDVVEQSAARGIAISMREYPIWMWHWSAPDKETTPWQSMAAMRLDDVSVEAKRRALSLHLSQVAPLSDQTGDEAVLNSDFLRNFDLDFEVFVGEIRPTVTGVPTEPMTLRPEYFDSTYERHDDPWGFETRWYEERKRDITIASLPDQRYGSVFEIGSSLGLLTERLAERSDRLLAVDISQAAVDRTTARVAGLSNVTVEQLDVSIDYPEGPFDLVVISEVGYYLDRADLAQLLERMRTSLTETGAVLLCHWRHPVADYPLTGDEVHTAARRVDGLHPIARHLEEDFVLEILSRDARSVAGRTGLLP